MSDSERPPLDRRVRHVELDPRPYMIEVTSIETYEPDRARAAVVHAVREKQKPRRRGRLIGAPPSGPPPTEW